MHSYNPKTKSTNIKLSSIRILIGHSSALMEKMNKLSLLLKIWHSSHCEATNVQANLCKYVDSPDPLLLVYTKYGCRLRLRTKWRPQNPMVMSPWTNKGGDEYRNLICCHWMKTSWTFETLIWNCNMPTKYFKLKWSIVHRQTENKAEKLLHCSKYLKEHLIIMIMLTTAQQSLLKFLAQIL